MYLRRAFAAFGLTEMTAAAVEAGSERELAGRLRPGVALYLVCVLALAVGGGLLGVGLINASSSQSHAHEHAQTGPAGLGTPFPTSFGVLQVESIAQIRGLTPKALAGMTHGIQSLVRADQMQVQLVIALRNTHGTAVPYEPAAFRLRVGRPGKSQTFESVSTSVRAGVLQPNSSMETTIGFVVPRFNSPKSRLTLELRDAGGKNLALDLGPVRRAGTTAANVQALYAGHQH